MKKTKRQDCSDVRIWRGKHWSAALPWQAATLCILAAGFMKYRTGFSLTSLGILPEPLRKYAALAEWGLLSAVAVFFIIAAASVMKVRYIITDEAVLSLTSETKGRMIPLEKISGCHIVGKDAGQIQLNPPSRATVRIQTPSGEYDLPDMESPSDFANLLNAMTAESDAALDKKRLDLETERRRRERHESAQALSEEQRQEELLHPDVPAPPAREMRKPLEELDSLIGLESVKGEVRTLRNFITVQNIRVQRGLPRADYNLHAVFTGNPGTGKTTVARIMAAIYHETGALPSDRLVETDRSGLVAGYVGQTAAKTNAVIDTAIGGVLFIDEAYTLAQKGAGDYGDEAMATLLKRMEDDRGRFAVIIAGYPEEMARLLDTNPGLRGRFPRTIHFPDYSAGELVEIFMRLARRQGYRLTDAAARELQALTLQASAGAGRTFGNARFIRNLFEATVRNQADRIMSRGYTLEDDDRLFEIKEEDMQGTETWQ